MALGAWKSIRDRWLVAARAGTLAAAALGWALVGCTSPPPTPRAEPAPPASSAPPMVSPAAGSADTAPVASHADAPAATQAPARASAPSAEPGPPPIACRDDDGCWLEVGPDGRDRPVERPKKLRGKKLRPCKDAEHTPACRDGVCVVRAWKC